MRYSEGVCEKHDHAIPVPCPACCYIDISNCQCECHDDPIEPIQVR